MNPLAPFATLRDKLRAYPFLLGALIGLVLIGLIAPQQLGVIAYKLTVLSLAAYAGYWCDRIIFPYARPDDFRSEAAGLFNAATLRRAIIVAACLVATALAL